MKRLCYLFLFTAMALLTGCSTSQVGVSVGNFSNSECLNNTRTAYATSTKLKLTRNGNNINGELLGYQANCWHGQLSVDCQQQGCCMDINVREHHGEKDLIANCLCPINIYFTLYDVEGDKFQLKLDGDSLGVVSFEEHNIVQIDTYTHDQTYEEDFDYPLLINYYHHEINALDPDGYNDMEMGLYYSHSLKQISGYYHNYFIPCDTKQVEVKLDVDEDGTLIISPLMDGKTTDGKQSGDCIRRSDIVFDIQNTTKDSYHVKVNPHAVTIKDEDGTEHEEVVCDFEGDLSVGEVVNFNSVHVQSATGCNSPVAW